MRSIRTATDYAEAVQAGEIVAGKPERDACARHLSDLKRDDLYYDYDLEKKVFAFVESLLLDLGEPFVLLPWQIFVTGSILCWHWKNGKRRFRRVYIETSKGSGKSPLVAAIMLHLIVNTKSKIINKGLFAGATEKQAGVAFKDLVAFVRNSKDLGRFLEIMGRGSPNKVWSPVNFSEIECIPYKAGAAGLSGVRPLCCVVDEYHEHSSDTTLRMLENSEKRDDSLLLVVTNAGPNKKVPCWEEHELACKVAEGNGSDTRFAYVAMCDAGEDPFTSVNPLSFLRKANPGWPTLPMGRDFLADIEDARGSVSRMNSFRRLYASQWIADTSAFIDPNIWESREKKHLSSEKKRKKAKAYIGIDLSLKGDLTSAAIVWDFGNRWECEVVSWTPSERVTELAHAGQIRREWIEEGWLRLCPGSTIRFADIARWIASMYRKYKVQGVAFDPSRFSEIEVELKRLGVLYTRDMFGDGLFLVPHSQQAKPPKGASEEYQETPRLWLGRSLEDLECAVLDGTLRYERNDTLRAANEGCAIKMDDMDWRHPSKKDSSWKIDPVVALMMACGYAAWTRYHDNMAPDWDAIDKFAKAFET